MPLEPSAGSIGRHVLDANPGVFDFGEDLRQRIVGSGRRDTCESTLAPWIAATTMPTAQDLTAVLIALSDS